MGSCDAYTLTNETSGTPVRLVSSTSVNLTVAGTGIFYSDPSCSTPISSATILSGTSSQTVYLSASAPQNLNLEGSSISTSSPLYPVKVLGNPTKLGFSVEPSGFESSGSPLTVQPSVQVQDALGNLMNTANNSITLAAFTDSGCTIAAAGTFAVTTNPLAANLGTASFAGVNYTGLDGTIYIQASAAGLTSACSSSITVGSGSATQLVFSTEPPTTAASGASFTTQPVLHVEDSLGNLASSATNSITLAAFSDSGCTVAASGTLTATSNPMSASSGVANFAGVTYTGSPGSVYLKATGSGLTSACSTLTTLGAGSASKLVFTTEPSATESSGSALGTQPVVSVEDGTGNVVTSSSSSITLAPFTDSSCTVAAGGALSATTNPLAASSGVSSFAGVTYTGTAATIYIKASTTSLTSVCSSAIVVSAGSASKLMFSTEPSSSAMSGTAVTVQPVIHVDDASGNLVSSAVNSITLAAFTDSGCTVGATGTFTATTNPLAATAGSASFSGMTYTGSASSIYVKASTGGLTSACSTVIAYSAGVATQLVFSTEPSATESSGTALGTQPVVQIKDASNNLVTSAANSITLAPFTDSGCTLAATGTLTATTNPLAATTGSASFAAVTYSGVSGTIYIKATTTGLTPACSTAITLSAGTAAKLTFSTEPSATESSGTALSTQPVIQVDDASGNFVSSASNAITLAAFTDSGCTISAGGTFGATTNPLNASSGSASFAGVIYTGSAGTIYIKASGTSLTPACSTAIVVSGGTATKLVYTTEPPTTEADGAVLTTQPVPSVEDASGNVVTSGTYSVSLTAYSDSGCSIIEISTMSQAGNPLSTVAGVANFTGISYAGIAPTTAYIKASAGGLTSACSTGMAVSAGTATSLAFIIQPNPTGNSGTALSTQPKVRVEDTWGNIVSSAANPITLAAFTDSGCTLAATGTFAATSNPLNASAGDAQFAGVTYTGTDGTIYVQASSGGLTSACSNAVVISAGSASKLVFSTEPSSTETSGTALAAQPVIQIEDALNNLVTTATNAVTLAAFTDSGCTIAAGGTFAATTNPLSATSGVASFAGVIYTGSGTIYIKASGTSLSSACSTAISLGATATQLAFSTQPSGTGSSGVALLTQPIVQVQDVTNTLVSSATNAITLAAFTDSGCTTSAPGFFTATTNPVSATSGSASFAGVAYTGASVTIYIKASATGLTSACSSAIVTSVAMVSVAANLDACALTGAGNVYCWGDNTSGQLGNNTTTKSAYPIPVLGVGGVGVLSGIISVGGGNQTECALSSAGNVYCWGYGSDGELGNNATAQSNVPVEVVGVGGSGFLSGIVSMSVGDGVTCAISSSSNAYCWGSGTSGQLGNGGTSNSHTPVEVKGVGGVGFLSAVTSIASGGTLNCAVVAAGNAYCWGGGYLGNGSNSESNTPKEVQGVGGSGFLSGLTSISSGDVNACAVSNSGNVYCWGAGLFDQIGNNSNSDALTPVEVFGVGGSGVLSGITSVSVGFGTTCAFASSGNIYCWGESGLGNNTSTNSLVPVEVLSVNGSTFLSGVTSVSAGNSGACTISTAKNVYCWGSNSAGQLGNNSASGSQSLLPVEAFIPGAISIGVGDYATCAASSAGNAYCWGDGTGGQLGNGSTSNAHTPVEVKGVGGVGFLSGVISVGSRYENGCALTSSGNIYCWGDNSIGQLGNGTTTNSHTAVEVLGVGGTGVLSGISAISVGTQVICALSTAGNVYCWGDNSSGEIGNNSTTNSYTPVEVLGVGGTGFLSGITAISTSYDVTCALSNSGNVYCWGDNTYGELGTNSTTSSLTPVEVLGVGGSGVLSGVNSIATNGANSCATITSGNVYCWGANFLGMLGNNSNVESNAPVEVLGVGASGFISGITSISSENYTMCTTSSSGNVYCWGDNQYGQVGNNGTTEVDTPVEALGIGGTGLLSGIVAVSEGYQTTCALSSAGNAFCWGFNGDGGLGNNTTTSMSTPVQVLDLPASVYLQL